MNEVNIADSIGNFEKLGLSKYEIVEKLREKGFTDLAIVQAMDSFSFQKKWNGSKAGLAFIAMAILFFVSATDRSRFSVVLNYHELMYKIKYIVTPTLGSSLLLVGIFMLIDKSNIQKSVIDTIKILLLICIVSSIVTFSFFTIILCMVPYIWFILWDLPVKPAVSDAAYLVEQVNAGTPSQEVLPNLGMKIWKGTNVSLWLLACLFSFIGISLAGSSPATEQWGLMAIVFTGFNFAIGFSLLALAILLYTNISPYRYWIFLVVILCAVDLVLLFFTTGITLGIIPPVLTIVALVKLIDDKKLLRYTSPVQA